MATASIKIDTTEAMEKLKELQSEADKLKETMAGLKDAINETKGVIIDFSKVCVSIKL